MNWCIAHQSVMRPHCGSCGATIGAGEAYATVSVANKPRCAKCVKATFNEEPPAELWAAKPETDLLPDVVRQAVGHGWVKVGHVPRDGKLAQLNEHDK